MKSLNLYQKYAIMLFLSCFGFVASFLICSSLLVEVKILVKICSIFLFSIILSFTGFHFSYENHLNSLKIKKSNLNKNYSNLIEYENKIIA